MSELRGNSAPGSDPDPPENAEDLLGLRGFAQPDDDGGLSLEALSAAYAELLDRGSVPYEGSPSPAQHPATAEMDSPPEVDVFDEPADAECEISPRSILEAMLFVGNATNEPLRSELVASMMRGVRPDEIDQLVVELNQEYSTLGCPYSIVAMGSGYVMQLNEAFRGLREKFRPGIRDARLSQAAVDVLAIVAYRQPIDREEIDRLRGRPSSSILSQLVRRQLLRLERPPEHPRRPIYHTTGRFLQLFGLRALEELPQSREIDG
jgi:segregation and condensation protein B